MELPYTDPLYGDGTTVGKVLKSMCGTQDAPQIWAEHVSATLEGLGYKYSVFQLAMYYHLEKGIILFVHVDDFLCVGDVEALEDVYQGGASSMSSNGD